MKMSFNSLNFCIRFLPVFLIAYYLIPARLRNPFLILSGFIYYGMNDYTRLPAVLTVLVINYLLNRFWAKKKAFGGYFAVGLNVVLLATAKFFGWEIPGISFLIFEMIALQVDTVKVQTDAGEVVPFFAYGLFFPKLMSGPITRYSDVKNAFYERKESLANVERGLVDFILGLGYKVLIADSLAGIYRGVIQTGTESISFGLALLAFYTIPLQIYFDFHGYTLMAKGMAEMVGIELKDNFDFPYFEKSVSEFFRKWHITLTEWFRDYLYIPLGGNRKGMARCILNCFLVWTLTGLWHGFTWNYLIWGLMLAFFISMEKLFLGKLLKKGKVLPHIYLWLVIPASWIFFMTGTPGEALGFFRQLFSPLLWVFGVEGNGVVYEADVLKHLQGTYPAIPVAIVFLIPKVEKTVRRDEGNWWRIALMTGIFLGSLYMMKLNQGNPFLYYLF